MNGKLTDVLIEDFVCDDPKTGMSKPISMLTVWADKGMLDVIRSVPGVSGAYGDNSPTLYHVFLDPRYDLAWVKAEIEAQIKIKCEL